MHVGEPMGRRGLFGVSWRAQQLAITTTTLLLLLLFYTTTASR